MASPFTFTPSQEFLNQRKKELSGKMIRLDLKQLRKFANHILSIKNKTDIGFTWNQTICDFTVMNKEEANQQMLLWKGLAKQDKLSILECNLREYEMDGGKKIYTMVVQPKDLEDCSLCPLSLALGTMVSGFTYAYTKKENRDMIYGYLKKYLN